MPEGEDVPTVVVGGVVYRELSMADSEEVIAEYGMIFVPVDPEGLPPNPILELLRGVHEHRQPVEWNDEIRDRLAARVRERLKEFSAGGASTREGEDDRRDQHGAQDVPAQVSTPPAGHNPNVNPAITWNVPEPPKLGTHYVWDDEKWCPLGWVPVCARCCQGPLTGEDEVVGLCGGCRRVGHAHDLRGPDDGF